MPHNPLEEVALAGGAETEEGRRPTLVSAPPAASPELGDRPRRRRFTAADKLRILAEVDRAGAGGGGAILRREGVYSSMLSNWRRQRDAGAYEALKAVPRGPKRADINPLAGDVAGLLRENKRLALRLARAEAVIEIQKNELGPGRPPMAVETVGSMVRGRGAADYFLVELTPQKNVAHGLLRTCAW